MSAKLLTDELISEMCHVARRGKRLEVSDSIEAGLRLRIGPRSARWSMLTNSAKRTRSRVDLGSWPTLDVNQARERARTIKQHSELSDTHSPSVTVGRLMDGYREIRLRQLRQGVSRFRSLQRLLEGLNAREVRCLTPQDIRESVKRLAKEAPVHANRSLAYCKAFFSWAVACGHMQTNPATPVRRPVREKPRNRILNLDELVEIWDAAEMLGYPFGHIVRLLILTAARRSEVGGMRADELDLPADRTDGTWLLPPERARFGYAVRIPLSPLARRVVQQALDWRIHFEDLVFTTNGSEPVSGWSKAKLRLDHLLNMSRGERQFPSWRFQDLRRSFARIAYDVMCVPRDVVDACLDRRPASKLLTLSSAEQLGALFDERKLALDEWGVLIEVKLRKQSTLGGGTVL